MEQYYTPNCENCKEVKSKETCSACFNKFWKNRKKKLDKASQMNLLSGNCPNKTYER